MESNILQTVCLDASVVLKVLVQEEQSDQATNILNTLLTKEAVIIEPLFLRIEVYSTIRKKHYLGEISSQTAKKVLAIFEQFDFVYLQEDIKLLNTAYILSSSLNQPVIYDALYLALVQKENASFVTADKRFLKKAKRVTNKAYLIDEAPWV